MSKELIYEYYGDLFEMAKKQLLPDELSLGDIAKLLFSVHDTSNRLEYAKQIGKCDRFIVKVLKLINTGRIKTKGTTSQSFTNGIPVPILSKDEVKKILILWEMWPLQDCLLANWWVTSSIQSKKIRPKTRITMLKQVVLDACEEYGRKPSIDELWRYFESDQDSRGIILDCTNEKVTWQTSKGDIKDTTRKTVQNMLSTITYPEVKS